MAINISNGAGGGGGGLLSPDMVYDAITDTHVRRITREQFMSEQQRAALENARMNQAAMGQLWGAGMTQQASARVLGAQQPGLPVPQPPENCANPIKHEEALLLLL